MKEYPFFGGGEEYQNKCCWNDPIRVLQILRSGENAGFISPSKKPTQHKIFWGGGGIYIFFLRTKEKGENMVNFSCAI